MSINAVWEYSLETESKRLLHTAHQISVYFYQTNGFLVLSAATKSLPDHAVIFPDLPYHTIPRFFDKAKKVNIDRPISADSNLTNALTNLLIQNGYSDNLFLNAAKLKSDWQAKESKILEIVSDIIPDTKHLLKSLIIHPTLFGTRHSFNRLTKTNNDLEIYLRYDTTVATITESILSALTRQIVFDNLSATWTEAEMVPDWLLMQSKLTNVVGDGYIPTVSSLRGNNAHYQKVVSDKYLAKIGFPHTSHLLTLKDDEIIFEDKPLRNLSDLQIKVLYKLISSGNLSTDDLADTIFSDDDKYSLYAMAKFMQRLRDKLESNGLTGSVIQTVRGYGYTMRV